MMRGLGTVRQGLLVAALGLVLVLAIARWKGTVAPGPQPKAASAGSESEDGVAPGRPWGRERKKASADDVSLVTAQELDSPRLTYEPPPARNLFEFRAPTAPPRPTPTPAPPPPCGSPALIGPCPPPPPPPTPAPPEISFKFIGSFGPKEAPIAVLVLGDQTVNARVGDTVFERFIVRKVGYESVDVGFVGFPPSEVRRVGLGQ